ncbi:MAG: hypothetical protein ACM357_04965 [Gemmatimonadota bacterium]
MADERVTVTLPDLARWLLVALLVLGGLGLYLWLAPGTAPVATEVVAP